MVARRVKKQDHEKLTDANIKRVAELLEGEKPITKKEACEILGISYNTTRLSKIIDEWRSDSEYKEKRKAEKRGKPATPDEIAMMAESYLEGDSIVDIAKRLFRSPGFVKAVIEKIGVPTRVQGGHGVALIPEQCIAEEFSVGEIAWAAPYNAPCEIRARLSDSYIKKYGVPCYRVWIVEKSLDSGTRFGEVSGGFNASIAAYDLGKLEHLKAYGVKVDKL